jgi:capsular exopolysaccharide synthesis family protein
VAPTVPQVTIMMNIEQYVRLFRKWLWLVIVVAVLFAAVGYLYSSTRPNEYRTTALINVGVSAILDPNPTNNNVSAVQSLTQTYAQLINTFNVREAAAISLDHLDISASRVARIVRVRPVPDTSLLRLEAVDTDPILAADVANAVAEQFVLQDAIISGINVAQSTQFNEVNAEIDRLNVQLDEARIDAREMGEALANFSGSREEMQALAAEYNVVLQGVDSIQSSIHRQVNVVAALKEDRNTLQIAETARVPRSPRDHDIFETTAIAAVLGALVAAGLVIVYDFFRNTLETSSDVNRLVPIPVIGVISRFGNRLRYVPLVGRVVRMVSSRVPKDNLLHQKMARPRTVEEYRTLRANLLTRSFQRGEKVFLVTSPSQFDGCSTTVANQAISIADANLKVLLVDADMRQPRQHVFFDVPKSPGLMSLLEHDDTEPLTAEIMQSYIHKTDVKGLYVLPAGEGIRSPSEMLNSHNAHRFIELLKTATDFDIVLLDTPPCLTVSDSITFTTFFDLEVLLVLRAGKTRNQEVMRAKERFSHLPEKKISVIMNGVDLSFEDYYSRTSNRYEITRSPQPDV